MCGVLHNGRFSLFNVSIVSKLRRIPFFQSETEPENDFTQMKKRVCTQKRSTKEQGGRGQIGISFSVLLAFKKKFSHCVIYMSPYVKEIERDSKRAEVPPLGSRARVEMTSVVT